MTQVSKIKLIMNYDTEQNNNFHIFQHNYNQAQIDEFIDLQNVESTLQVEMPQGAALPRQPENPNHGHSGKW